MWRLTGGMLCLLCYVSGCHLLTHETTGTWPEHHGYCRCADDWFTVTTAQCRAHRALLVCFGGASCDFRQGFVQAYVDVALGGNGQVPVVPPERYWQACFRTAPGHARVAEWFAGYAAGAEQALASYWYPHQRVPASGAAGACSGSYAYPSGCGP